MVRALFAPQQNYGAGPRDFAPQRRERRGNWPAGPRVVAGGRRAGPYTQNPYAVVSQQMAASPLYLGHRTAIPRREALILQAALNHPWLLHDHVEELGHLEFRHLDVERLKNAAAGKTTGGIRARRTRWRCGRNLPVAASARRWSG
jgi:hypothetical protein